MRLKDEAMRKSKKLKIRKLLKNLLMKLKMVCIILRVYLVKKKKNTQYILKEINERLNFLLNVGLNYLTLSRESGTLSCKEVKELDLHLKLDQD